MEAETPEWVKHTKNTYNISRSETNRGIYFGYIYIVIAKFKNKNVL